MRSLKGRKRKTKKHACVLALMMAACLTGCALPGGVSWPLNSVEPETASSDGNAQDAQFTSLGLTPDLSYDKPVMASHVEVDQLGYRRNDRKIAIFRGDVLGESFDVISTDDGRVVFTGEIESRTRSGTGESCFFGDFSEVTGAGTYYVRTDVIGYSYPFSIGDDVYEGLFDDSLRQYYLNRCGVSLTAEHAGESARSACHADPVTLQQDAGTSLDVTGGWHVNAAGDRIVIKGCNAIEALLMAYEYNTEAFGDDVGIPESGNGIPDILDELKVETDWILKMQDQSTGAVYSGVISTDKGLGLDNPVYVAPADMSTTLGFASALGYFSYVYQSVDTGYATTCLQAADRAMKYVAKAPDAVDEDERFRAAAMLYRATGYQRYKTMIDDYCAERSSYDIAENEVFAGVITYLATKQKTDQQVCAVMMNNLRSYAEDTSSRRKDVLYLLGDNGQTVEFQSLLSEIARLTVVNYVISSNEYETLMEQYLHFVLGCNPGGTCYAGQYGSVNASDGDPSRDVLRQPENNAYFVLLLSGV